MLPGFVYVPPTDLGQELLSTRGQITDTYGRGQNLPAPAVALVLGTRGIYAVGLLKRGDAVTTFQRRIILSDVSLVIGDAVNVQQLIDSVPARLKSYAEDALRAGGPISTATWTALRVALMQHDEVADLIQRIEHRLEPPGWIEDLGRPERHVVEQEQDAAGLALEFGGLGRLPLSRWDPTDDPAPFLAGLEHVVLIEDQLLINDMQIFGDWEHAGTTGFMSQFTDQSSRKVTILNVNRHSLEATLGVDLVYYSHAHNAFSIVQYKRMRSEGGRGGANGRVVYRPSHDNNLPRQLERMRAIEEPSSTEVADRMAEHRLGLSTCFLKVCRPDLRLGSGELAKGMYFDLALWALALRHLSSSELNPSIAFDKDVRYLNNTDFITLVKGGWIGSRGATTASIEQYINLALHNRHSVTLATAST